MGVSVHYTFIRYKRLESAASPRFLGKLEMTKSGGKRLEWVGTYPSLRSQILRKAQDDIWGDIII
jgi:hypothetical protein